MNIDRTFGIGENTTPILPCTIWHSLVFFAMTEQDSMLCVMDFLKGGRRTIDKLIGVHQLLNSLMQHLFIVLDEKRYIYKVQYKESIEVLVSKILPMLETILEDTSNELLNLLTLDLRLEFMFSIQETTTIPKLNLEKMLSVANLKTLKDHYLSLSTVLLRIMITFLEQLKLRNFLQNNNQFVKIRSKSKLDYFTTKQLKKLISFKLTLPGADSI